MPISWHWSIIRYTFHLPPNSILKDIEILLKTGCELGITGDSTIDIDSIIGFAISNIISSTAWWIEHTT
jgi:hypothetical protein